MRTNALYALTIAALLSHTASAQHAGGRTLHWVGGSGHWSDAAHWSLQAEGTGGAAVPGVTDDAVITADAELTLMIDGSARCHDLQVDARAGFVRVQGDERAELRVLGDWRMQGSIHWDLQGRVRLMGDAAGLVVDTRGIPLSGQLTFDGAGSWTLMSDLLLREGDITFKEGTVHSAGGLLTARTLCSEGRASKRLMAGSGLVQLAQRPEPGVLERTVNAQDAILTVGGEPTDWPQRPAMERDARDVNVCATGAGQTPFTATTSALTNYNGFNVRCRGDCNATVTVNVAGGIGPFTYSWLFGGPATQTWTTACGGPQIVVVTDQGQGVSCGVTLNVTEPSPLGVIFFGQGTPPTCADVCNGTRTALAIGGVTPHTYDWNNGAGSGSSFSQLCAGVNSLRITDANNCTFDTTFTFNLLPISPGLSFTSNSCFGDCNGTATVNPTGGTAPIAATWSPAPGGGQGTYNATGLCAGNYTVLLSDANGCDTTVAFTITQPPPILPNALVTNATCFGACDGAATVTPSGSPGPFVYGWTPSPGGGQGTGSATGLCAGNYTVLITDQVSGCDTLVPIVIDAPPSIDIQGTVTDASCSNTCDGEISIVVNGAVPPFTITWSPAPPVGQGTQSINGLCPGDWSCTFTNSNGCDTTVIFTVDAPPPLVASVQTTDATCAGECDGMATCPAVTGGTAPYTFLWSPAPGSGQGTDTALDLCAGNYTLLISDANGCDTTIAFVINEPPPLQVVPSQTNVTCGGQCDGTASVAVSGGVPTYTYQWTPAPGGGQGTANATGLCAGAYSVLITDANGCTFTQPFTILDAVPLQISLQVLPASCPGDCDGSADVIVTGGQAPYSYNWQPAPSGGQGTPNATGLCAQAYSLTITDFLGCDSTIAFTVPAPPPIDVTSTVTDPTCSVDCDGTIDLVVSGGNGTFTFNWSPDPGSGQGTANAGGLCAGSYQVVIASGACDTTLTFQLTAPLPIDASLTTTDPSCAGDCDATASLSVSGGTPPYGYVWAPAPGGGQGTPDAVGLCPGNYTVQVTDAAGCDTLIAFVINDPLPITVDLETTPASCGGACDGTATATVTGGVQPYTYDWQPAPGGGQGTPNATGLCPGAYVLTVSDANGCTVDLPFTISTPSGIDAQFTSTPASCGNTCDGTVNVVATGGIQPYTWTWSPEPGAGQGTPNVSGLCPGTYTLQITDAAQCDTVIQVLITSPPPIVPNGSSTDETCNGPCDGTATVNPSGGQPPFSFVWNPAPPVGQGTNSVSLLCPGLWSVTITDAIGCDTTITLEVMPKDPIVDGLVWTNATCPNTCDGTASVNPTGGIPPITDILWIPNPPVGQGTANVSGLCLGSWEVRVFDSVGCFSSTTFFVSAPPPFQSGLVTTPETCDGPCTGTATVAPSGGTGSIGVFWDPPPGGGQGTSTATGLCAGITYSVTLTDDSGCDSTFTFTIDPFAEIVPNSSSTPVSCFNVCDGTATVGPTGGVGPYTYSWSPEPGGGQNSPQATGLCAGIATVTITDLNGCSIEAEILIDGPQPILDNAVVEVITCAGTCDGSVTLAVTGGVAPYTYQWTPVPPNGQGQPTASSLCPGNYTVVVTDAAGCSASFSYDLSAPPPLALSLTLTPSECQNCIGAASVAINGGALPYGIEWLGSGGAVIGTDPDITDLCAGLYSVRVTDGNGCIAQQAVVITDSDGEAITTTDGTTSCPNTCDGTVSVSFTCSDPTCVIAWSDALGNDLGQSGTSLNGLCPGDYLVSVTNASGCLSIDTATVVAPPPTELLISSSPVSCAGACDGVATVGVSGGIPPYQFTWSPAPGGGQGTPQATGLCVGVYEVLISDGGGCDTTAQVLITEPNPLTSGAIVLGVSCSGQCDGSVTLAIDGGTQPYAVIWSPVPPSGQGVPGAFGLCAGDWTATITDANGCTLVETYAIAEPQPLLVSVNTTPSTCPNCDGQAEAVISGGTMPYDVSWTLGATVVSTDPLATDLCGGLYQLTVSDANGCSVTQMVQVPDSNAEALTPQNGQTTCANNCDGTVGVSFTCTSPACNVVWTDSDGNVIATNTPTVSNLCVGVYTAQVTNGSGCVSFIDAEVLPSQSIIPNLSSTPASCFGLCDGTATVNPVGLTGTPTFTWSPEPGGGQSTPQATGLCVGVYTVLIADATGCDTLVQVLITGPDEIAIDGIVQDITCSGACDGAVDAVVSGGTAPYLYDWSPAPALGQGTPNPRGFCAGVVTLSITDANGCTSQQFFDIAEPALLQAALSTTQSQCSLCNGTAAVAVSGGTQPYFVAWSSGANVIGSGESISGLCAGLYSVTVTDSALCSLVLTVVISDIDGEELTMADDVTSCPGACDGEVSVSFNCQDPPCQLSWFDAGGNNLNEPGNVLGAQCAGTYFAQVTNASGCVSIDTAFVTEPDPIVPNLSTTPVSCASACDGTATVGPTGGSPGYTFLWSPGGEDTPQVTGLCAGSYSVTITDLAGCSIVVDVLITGPQPLTASETISPITCNGACDGAITVVPAGGTQPYTYSWSPAPPGDPTQPTVIGLCAGDWSVTITDANGCDTSITYTLTDPEVLDVQLNTTDNACFGDCQGTAALTLSGGVPPYGITWFNSLGAVISQDMTDIADLCVDDYSVEVVDANGCTVTLPFNIGQGPAIEANLTFTGETCFGPCDGTAAVSPSGGLGTFIIEWRDADGNLIALDVTDVTGLCAGDHSVTIIDQLGCDSTYAFTILPYTAIADGATVTDVRCNGACDGSIVLNATGGVGPLSYDWNPVPPNGQGNAEATDLCPGTYSVTITDGAGCGASFSYTINEPSAITVTVDAVTDASCANALDGAISITAAGGVPDLGFAWSGPSGFSSSAEDLTGIAPGAYVLTVTDANNCTLTVPVTVNALSTVQAEAGADVTECAGVDITLDGSLSIGALTYQWLDDQGNEVGTTPTVALSALTAGVYVYTLNVADGPCSSTDQVTVTVLDLPLADAGNDQTIFLGDVVTLGGAPTAPSGSTISWQPDSLVSDAASANPTTSPQVTTWYSVLVTSPNGCVSLDSVLVTVVPEVVIPTGFTPNGDGWNETWQIDFIDLFPECEVEVYNRWGDQLFRSVGYQKPWDGKYNGGFVPVGTYYYVIQLNDPRFPEAYTGPLTVIR